MSVCPVCVCAYQRSRVKLGDHVVEEDCEVSRSRLQQVNALETAALSIDLRIKISSLDEDTVVNFSLSCQ